MIARLAIMIVLGWAHAALAQPSATFGSVRGQLVEQTGGAPVAGAIVVATSSALQAEQTTITDERGVYFVSALPPGPYRLTVYYLDRKFTRDDVVVQLGKQVVVNIALDVTGSGEIISIAGRAPLIDQGSTKLGVTIAAEYTRNVPTGRTFGEVAGAAAGAHRDLYGISLAGTTSPETSYVVDGLVTTDPLLGTLSANLPNEFIAETEVITGGYNAEFGRVTGGVVNVITKRGSNELHGSVFGHFRPAGLAAEAATIQREGSAVDSLARIGNGYDAGAEIGGPILVDRLWFHTGFVPRVERRATDRIIARQIDADQNGVPDLDPDTGFTVHEQISTRTLAEVTKTYYFTAKLTGAVGSHHQGELAAFGNPGTNTEPTFFGLLKSPQALIWRREGGSYNVNAKWTSKLNGGATELAGSGGFHRTYERIRDYDDRPSVRYTYERSLFDFADIEGVTLAECNDDPATDVYPLITNCPVINYGEQGLGVISDRRDDRASLALSVTHRVRLAGYHVFKLGIDAELASDASTYHATGGYLLTRGANARNGAPGRWRLVESMRVTRNLTSEERANPTSIVLGDGEEVCPDRDAICALADPVGTSTSAGNIGSYLQDSWLITPSLTLNAGLRWDHQSGYVADEVVGRFTPEGELIGERVFELDNVAPRLGVVYDPTGQGLAKLFAHYGRFYETLPLTASDLFANALFAQTLLNGKRLREGQLGYDPSCNVDHGTPNLAETIRACSDRGPRDAFQAFEFVSPGLRGQYTEEIVVGAEYQVVPDLKLGASLQHRVVPIVIEDISMDGGNALFITNPGESFDGEAAKLRSRAQQLIASSDPADQQLATVYETRAGWLERVDELDKPLRNYNALHLTATLRPTSASLLLASYTYSTNRGNYPGLFSPETGQLIPNLNAFFDLPNLSPNRSGVLGLDRPHNARIDGFYRFTLPGDSTLTAGASLRAQSGIAYTALATHPSYGAGESFLLRAGSVGRTPATGDADIHLAFAHATSKSSALEVFVDVFNLFNAQVETSVDQRYTRDTANQVVDGSLEDLDHVKHLDPLTGIEENRTIERNPNFANTTERQRPRTIQLGVRWLF
jgi:outer membrane receptor protein involved in Fe transport